jgi:hypothetical protein
MRLGKMRSSVKYGDPVIPMTSAISRSLKWHKSHLLDSLLSKDQLNEPDLEGDDGLLIDSEDILLKDSVGFPAAINEIKSDTARIGGDKIIENYHFKCHGIARKRCGTGDIEIVFLNRNGWLMLNEGFKKLREAYRIQKYQGFLEFKVI